MSEVTTKLNQLHATLIDFYYQYKHFHWHFQGQDFYQYHLLFDKHATTTFEAIDIVAERIRQLDDAVLTHLENLGAASVITATADNRDFDLQGYILPHLHNNHLLTIQLQKQIIDLADDDRDPSTADLITKVLIDQELMNWFIKSSMNPNK